jgi:amino acid transporter
MVERPRSKKIVILKGIARYLSIVAIIVFILIVVISIITTFPDYVPISNADNLLQIWITANGVLMGFAGIIFAQLISSTMDQQNTLYERILEEELSNKHHTKELKKRLNDLDTRRIVLSIDTAFTLIFLAYSILLSMQAIARNSLLSPTDVYAVAGFMSGPLYYSVIGIALLILALVLPLKPPLEEALESELGN